MIETLKFTKRSGSNLVDFVNKKNSLYITKDNKRKTIKSLKDLKLLYRESAFSIAKEDNGTIKGLLFVWKSDAFNIKRNYVKIEYESLQDVDDLLMVLNWNFSKEVYVKLDRHSPLINCFRKKGFKFCHDRGNEVLLFRTKNERTFIPPFKGDEDEEDINE
jgi:hypothetical protein